MVLIILPLLTAFISLVVTFGWFARWTIPLTIFPNSPPMVFNTALCLLFLSLSFLSPYVRRLHWFRNSWVISLAIALLSGMEYFWDINFGIDEVFVEGYLRTLLSHPGRMAPLTAICFIVASSAWGILRVSNPRTEFLSSVFAFVGFGLVAVFGFLSVLAYLTDFYSFSGWGVYTKMAFLTGLSFIFLGTHGVVCSFRRLLRLRSTTLQMIGVMAGALAFFAMILYWQISVQKESQYISKTLEKEIQNRYQQFYQSFQLQAEDLLQMQVPSSRSEAQKRKWSPPLPAVEAVIALKAKPELIWERGGLKAEKDLRLLSEQIVPGKDFHFYPSFYFQRSRWMAFSFGHSLVIFSPQVIVENFFPTDQFLYSITLGDQVLLSSGVGVLTDLNIWDKQLSFRLWDSEMKLHVSPTRSTLSRLSLPLPVHFIVAGCFISLAVSLFFVFAPRFCHPSDRKH